MVARGAASPTGIKPPAWTPEEDKRFIEILEREVIEKGTTSLEDVYPIVAKELGRPEGGCKYRYTSTIRKSLTGKLKEKLVTNSPRASVNLQQSSGQNLRSKLIAKLSQVDRDMVKIDSEIVKAEKSLADLREKKVQLANDMERYTEELVKSARNNEKEE